MITEYVITGVEENSLLGYQIADVAVNPGQPLWPSRAGRMLAELGRVDSKGRATFRQWILLSPEVRT